MAAGRSGKIAAWVLGAAAFGGLVAWLAHLKVPVAVTTADSPDARYRAEVRQPRFIYLDRNFRVVLTDLETGRVREVFRSQDQSPTIRSERIVWAADSDALALIGDKYFVLPGSTLPGGATLFLTFDLPAGTVACNSDLPHPFPRATPAAALARFGDRLDAR